ncbi:dephospho-CoA kinase [Aquibaculum sediminis]|uniref:dephospho-CoA kinase n=1 Tax=Aquibaculum sediminis TaxID=3231907 RepID=UPI003454904F
MRVLGLTGSIGMGKSTAASMLRRIGLPVHDADAAVHRLFAAGGAAVPAIEAAFPDSVVEGAVDRRRLGAAVFGDPAALRRLEAIVHPLVRAEALAFLRRHRRARRPLVVLDIPLLYETGGDRLCDAVALVTAPSFLQEQRVLRRPGMTAERLAAVRAQQMPDREKRRRADFLVLTGRGKGDTFRQLRRIVRRLCPAVATCANEGTGLDA